MKKTLTDLSNELIYGDIIKRIAEQRDVGEHEARNILSQLSFRKYNEIVIEATPTAIVPPSGQAVGPSAVNQQSQAPKSKDAPTNVKAIWPGAGAPVEVGMTVGLTGPAGVPVPGAVSQVDLSAKGVKVKNPTTGQDEWRNIDELEPFMAGSQNGAPGNAVPQGVGEGHSVMPNIDSDRYSSMSDQGLEGPFRLQSGKVVYYDPKEGKYYDRDSDMYLSHEEYDIHNRPNDLSRMRQLAGIRETCSSGATGAGSIAIAPAAMGKMNRRQQTDEVLKKEHGLADRGRKTIVGDTKPAQASGELSSTLAANGKKTASRKGNGIRK
jgi:hypothetical protein